MTKVLDVSELSRESVLRWLGELPPNAKLSGELQVEIPDSENVWAEFPAEERAELEGEFAFWNRVSDRSFTMILEMEREEGESPENMVRKP